MKSSIGAVLIETFPCSITMNCVGRSKNFSISSSSVPLPEIPSVPRLLRVSDIGRFDKSVPSTAVEQTYMCVGERNSFY